MDIENQTFKSQVIAQYVARYIQVRQSALYYSSVFMSYQCTPLQRYCLCVSCGTLWNQAILMLATMVNWHL